MADWRAFMNLEYVEKGKKCETKWVWTGVVYLWVSGASYKLQFHKVTEVF